jgi:hypothetical protein
MRLLHQYINALLCFSIDGSGQSFTKHQGTSLILSQDLTKWRKSISLEN